MQTQLSHTNTPLELWLTAPLVLDLTLLPTSPTPSIIHPSTPPPDSHPTAPPSKPRKLSMWFPSPTTQSLGMCTALAWHREQLLEARQKLELRNRNQLRAGLLPVTNHLMTRTTSTSVLSAPVSKPTVTAHLSPCLHRQHPYLSHLNPHCPNMWDKLSSIVSKPRHWSLDSPLPSMLRFAKHCPTWTMITWMQPLMT
jgi:hypothetical protein